MSQTAALYQLQTLDSEIDNKNGRIAEIDRLLGQNEVVRRAQQTLDKARKSLRKWETRQTDLEPERHQIKDEADRTEDRLYKGKIHNPRELTDLQDKLAELNQRHSNLEEPIIEAMLEIEEAKATVTQSEAALERVLAEQADTFEALREERSALVEDLAELEERARSLREDINAEHLRLYDRLRASKNGLAVTRLSANAECQKCGMQTTSLMRQQVRRGEVKTCPTCGRILYHP